MKCRKGCSLSSESRWPGEPGWSSRAITAPIWARPSELFARQTIRLSPAQRFRAAAQKQLQIRGVTEQLAAEHLLRHSEALRAFLAQKFQAEKRIVKYGAERFLTGQDADNGKQGRLLELEADLYLETPNGVVVTLLPPLPKA